jgi:hypothetical protein
MPRQSNPTRQRAAATIAAGMLMLSTVVCAELAGQGTPDMSWFTIDNGGGPMVAETIGVTVQFYSTIGQPDAHAPGAMHADGFVFAPGFWHDLQLAPHSCTGDVAPPPHGDGFVDVDDLILVVLTWGQVNGAGDADGNGIVDVDDLITVILHWGVCP